MTALVQQDIDIIQGDTFQMTVVYKDSSKVPINMTGWTVQMQIRDTVDSEEALIDLSSDDDPGGIVLTELTAHSVVTITSTLTGDLEFAENDQGVYDIVASSDDDPAFVVTLVEGIVNLNRRVTR